MKFYTGCTDAQLKAMQDWMKELLTMFGADCAYNGLIRGITKGALYGGIGVLAGIGIYAACKKSHQLNVENKKMESFCKRMEQRGF